MNDEGRRLAKRHADVLPTTVTASRALCRNPTVRTDRQHTVAAPAGLIRLPFGAPLNTTRSAIRPTAARMRIEKLRRMDQTMQAILRHNRSSCRQWR